MSYASGGNIQAADFNGIASQNGANVAYTWGIGSQKYGWGQSTTLLSLVSSGGTVTAAQWAGLVYTINKCLAHIGITQLGGGVSGANINYVAGQTITYFANVTAATANIGTQANAQAYTTQGTTVTGSNFTNSITYADSSVTRTTTITRTVTFAGGGDGARYFFNAGGQLNLVVTAVNTGATGRGADYVTLFQTNLNSVTVKSTASSWNGTDSNASPQNSTLGYWNLTTSSQLIANVRSAGGTYLYWNDYVSAGVKTNGVQGTHSDNGSTITFDLITSQPVRAGAFNNSVNVTVTTRIDIIPPETTFLANTWGVIGIT